MTKKAIVLKNKKKYPKKVIDDRMTKISIFLQKSKEPEKQKCHCMTINGVIEKCGKGRPITQGEANIYRLDGQKFRTLGIGRATSFLSISLSKF